MELYTMHFLTIEREFMGRNLLALNVMWKYMEQDRVTTLILVLSLLPTLVLTCCNSSEFNVLDYGAFGDGIANDILAFVEAWNETCNVESDDASMVVPEGMTFLVYPMAFVGPCNPTYITFLDRVTTLILVLSLLPTLVLTCCDSSEFNVLDYGAFGDGIANDTLAFVETWNRTCNAESDDASMVVPEGKTFLVNPMAFVGPCNPTYITFLLSGTIIAPDNPEAWKGRNLGQWLTFQDVNGLGVSGLGKIDGRGQVWWDISCKRHPQSLGCGKLAPTVLSFIECNQFSISNILIVNSPQTHILVTGCNNVMIDSLSIKSPETSPNTDGIHISHSTGVFVSNTDIGSGDDCVSIGDYTSHIDITDVNCGPGHGVSIGSLGRSGNEVRVENINVNRVNFNKTSNGVRIKTWQVGRGHVRGVVFKNINFTDVKNPIIINQNYCDVQNACKRTKTGVEISHVRYSGTFGTSKTKVAINLDCSQAVPCTNILLDTVELESSSPGKRVISFCNNAYGNATGVVKPNSCLLKQFGLTKMSI